MFLRAYLWSNTDFIQREPREGDHREGVKLGTSILINLDTVASIIDKGNSPPAVTITFKRDEARDPLDVYGSVAYLEIQLDQSAEDGRLPALAFATIDG